MSLTLFGKNIIRLFKFDLKYFYKNIRKYEHMDLMLDNLKYEIADEVKTIKLPKVLGPLDSIKEIIRTKKSVARFGDGEFNLILGNGIGFQEFDPKLQARLKEVLTSQDENMLIGISDRFGSLDNLELNVRNYWRDFLGKYRQDIYKMLDFNRTYIDTHITAFGIEMVDHTTEEARAASEEYYNEVRKIWDGQDITVIKGADNEKFENNIYDNAKSVSYIYGPKAHAFREYDRIFEEAKKLPKDRLILIVLGPTAKPLAYDLTKLGYRALDLGHMAKAYEWLKTRDKIVAGQFFAA